MNRLLIAALGAGCASIAVAQDADTAQTCLITFYGNPLVESSCTMTLSEEEGLLQITGEVPGTGESYSLVASDATQTATLTTGDTFILAAGRYETTITNGGATINWPNGYALNATAAPE
jgi:hypothetical protein